MSAQNVAKCLSELSKIANDSTKGSNDLSEIQNEVEEDEVKLALSCFACKLGEK